MAKKQRAGKQERLDQLVALSGTGTDIQVLDRVADVPTDQESVTDQSLVEGLILDGSRGIYRVETDSGSLLCTIRGRLRKQLVYAKSEHTTARKSVREVKRKTHDPVAIGDRVRVLPTGGGEGVIEEVVARVNGSFTRHDPGKGQGQLTSITGLDQLVATFAVREPTPHLRVLDRLLVLAEAQEIAAAICFTKLDLGLDPWLEKRLAVYRHLGYPVLLVSAVTGEGLAEFSRQLAGRTSALLGPSGVGKSSLLNAIQPELGQKVSAVSGSTGKGRHTTTGTRLFPLAGPQGGYLADTAGFRALALDGNALSDLDSCFREFRPFLASCPYANDCSHLHEPGCAVRKAVTDGLIDHDRYNSYRRLRDAGDEPFDLDALHGEE